VDKLRVREIVQEIWDDVPRDQAWVRLDTDPDGTALMGNREGLLRLGAEVLAASDSPTDPSYLFKETGPNWIESIFVSYEDRPSPPTRTRPFLNKLGGVGCLALLVMAVVCAAVGFFTLAKMLFR
jgi:hypothetical protein